MRRSPLPTALLYIVLGSIFTYLAVGSVKDTIWNFYTLLLIAMATFDFGLAIRLLALTILIRKSK